MTMARQYSEEHSSLHSSSLRILHLLSSLRLLNALIAAPHLRILLLQGAGLRGRRRGGRQGLRFHHGPEVQELVVLRRAATSEEVFMTLGNGKNSFCSRATHCVYTLTSPPRAA